MKTWAFDTETHLIQPGLKAPPLVCGSIADAETEELLDRAGALAWFRRALEGVDHIVGANIAYDLGVVSVADSSLLPLIFKALDGGRIHDIEIRQTLHWIAQGWLTDTGPLDPRTWQNVTDPETGKTKDRFSLAVISDINLNRKIEKRDTWRMKYALLANTPITQWPEEAKAYPKADARNTWDNWDYQQNAPFENLHAEAEQVAAAFALQLASIRGIRTDPKVAAEVIARVDAQYKIDLTAAAKAGIVRAEGAINPETGKPWPASQIGSVHTGFLKDLVTVAYKGNPPRTGPTERFPEGQVKTDRDTLLESGVEILETWAEAGENKKLHEQYLKILLQGTEIPICPEFDVLKKTTRTGYRKPNLQNQPRNGGIREAYAAREGFLYCSTDYASLEMCTGAQTCIRLFGYSKLADAINGGADTHLMLVANAIGRDYADVLAAYKAGDQQIKNYRQGAKPGNYGFWGGMGPAKFVWTSRKDGQTTKGPDGREYAGTRYCILLQKDTVCGREKVTEWKDRAISPTCLACIEAVIPLKEAWFEAWPEARQYFEEYIGPAVAEAGDAGAVLEIPGTGIIKGGCGYCDGANLGIQGPAAVGAKRAFYRLARECFTDRSSPLWGARPLLFLHDESFTEIPITDHMHEAAYRQATIMVDSMREVTPDVAIAVEPALMSHWYKAAATVHDANGRLIEWRPK